jgi:hypothetical protein
MFVKMIGTFKSFTLFALAFLLASQTSGAAEVGGTYFTQYNMWVERETHKTTNYSRGELIPVNTKVVLHSVRTDEMTLDVDGRLIEIDNIRKHTQRSINEIADEMLGTQRVNTRKFGEEFQGDTEAGNLRLGMTKEAVLVTRGYPPRHKTASTKANTWTYWSSRFVHRTLVFRDGELVEGRGLY